ncbi:MAG TPA: hypothetical protein VN943_03490 [Candidatus Acidoferrum sp.]|nr:hypothetical protein [Candidatus Acidoferrum sp.]
MPQEIDEFTIPLPESTDMSACDLKVYGGLDRLWRMVERYKMTAPLTIHVVDNEAGHVRAICGNHHQATDWQLTDGTSAMVREGESKFPLTIRVQDARGNILKMRLVARN